MTDIIDFDYYISSVPVTLDNEEERQLYLNHIEPELTASEKESPGKIISLWVKTKRDRSSKLSPGQIFNSGLRLIVFIFTLTGFLAGIGAAASYLSYSGTRPVNIAVYLFVFVFSQMFLQTLSILTLISHNFSGFSDFFNTPYSLVLHLIKKTAAIGAGKISADKRMGVDAAIGKIKINTEKFGEIYFWTMFKIFQFTGLMFSTGVVIATLFKVITSDLAFGWQTTIQTAPEKIVDMVHCFALPWSWMMSPDLAYPDLNNIEGSQILLKDGIVNLVSSDMAAWWPFLCLAVIFYTIIPRVFLLFTGIFFERRSLKKTFLNSNSADTLIRMLTSPQMVVEKNRSELNTNPETDDNFNLVTGNGAFTSGGTLIALVPEDIFSPEFTLRLEEKVREKSGIIDETIQVTGDIDEDFDIITTLHQKFEPGSSGSVLIVYESWLPPIKETIDYIKSIREHSGKRITITIWLSGKPASFNNEYCDVEDTDFKIWNWKILAMGDPDISVTRDKNNG